MTKNKNSMKMFLGIMTVFILCLSPCLSVMATITPTESCPVNGTYTEDLLYYVNLTTDTIINSACEFDLDGAGWVAMTNTSETDWYYDGAGTYYSSSTHVLTLNCTEVGGDPIKEYVYFTVDTHMSNLRNLGTDIGGLFGALVSNGGLMTFLIIIGLITAITGIIYALPALIGKIGDQSR